VVTTLKPGLFVEAFNTGRTRTPSIIRILTTKAVVAVRPENTDGQFLIDATMSHALHVSRLACLTPRMSRTHSTVGHIHNIGAR
jgi:hypothetical protein